MIDIYRQAFDIIEQTETAIDYHVIVTMIIKHGYNQTLLKLIGEA